VLGSLYGGLGAAQVTQNALNKVWAIPRQARPNPLRARLRSLLLLVVLGTGILATTLLSGVTTGGGALNTGFGPASRLGAIAISIALNGGIFFLAFKLLTARKLTWPEIRLGVIVAATGWEVLQLLGTYYLSHKLKGSSETYGVFGLVLGLVAWLALEALVVVLAAEINVVAVKHLYPRSLLTPFTDNVTLTNADERAYTSYVQAERHKGFQEIDVRFNRAVGPAGPPPPDRGAAGQGPDRVETTDRSPQDRGSSEH
jgi:uncharacterized BrkB/YihY/UPF0761 family membrane protein